MSDVNASLSLSLSKGGVQFSRSFNANFDIGSRLYVSGTPTIGITDETLDLGDVVKTGVLLLKNLEARYLVGQPSAPTITPQGTTGAATWSYKIVAKQMDSDSVVTAYSQASSAGTTATGNATLTGGNYNKIDWAADANATGGYDIWRTAHGSSPSTNGLIGHAPSGTTTFNDTGLAGDSATAPASEKSNLILLGDDGVSSYPVILRGGDIALIPWNSGDYGAGVIHAIALYYPSALEYILLAQ